MSGRVVNEMYDLWLPDGGVNGIGIYANLTTPINVEPEDIENGSRLRASVGIGVYSGPAFEAGDELRLLPGPFWVTLDVFKLPAGGAGAGALSAGAVRSGARRGGHAAGGSGSGGGGDPAAGDGGGGIV